MSTKKIKKSKVEKKAVEKSDKVEKPVAKKEVVVRELKMPVKLDGKEINPVTGTRFDKNSARQVALTLVIKFAKDGMKVREMRKEIVKHRKEHGGKYQLDTGYVNFVLATHPEFFKVYSDGTVKVIGEPQPDPNAKEVSKSKKVKEMRNSASAVRKIRKKSKEEASEDSAEDKAEEKTDKKPKIKKVKSSKK